MGYNGPDLTASFLWQTLLLTPQGRFALGVLCLNILVLVLYPRFFLANTFSYRHFTIPAFFLSAYGLTMLPGSAIFFAHSTHLVRNAYFGAAQAAPILILIGVSLANLTVLDARKRVSSFLLSPIRRAAQDGRFALVYVTCMLVGVALIILYIFTADYVPLLGGITRYGEMRPEDTRFSIYRSPDAIIFAYALTMRFLLPVSVLYTYFMSVVSPRRWKPAFFMTLTFTLFASLLTFERQLPLSVLVLLGIATYLRRLPHFMGRILALAAVAAITGGFVSFFQYNMDFAIGDGLSYARRFVLIRLWIDPSYMCYMAFEQFASRELLLGRSIHVLSSLGFENEYVAAIGFLGDVWINFGWTGVILGPVALGFFLQSVQLRLFLQKTVVTTVVYTLFLLNAGWLIYGNMLSTMVVTVYGLGIPLLLFARRSRTGGARRYSFHPVRQARTQVRAETVVPR